MSPRAFTEAERARVREKLIEAARRFLSTTGIKKTSVEELAKAAGISKGAFYMFYESKELLFMDALDAEQQIIHDALIERISKAPDKKSGFMDAVQGMIIDFMQKPWLLALSGEEYEQLLSRVPQDRIMQHIEEDDAASKRFCMMLGIGNKTPPELLSAVLRMVFLGMLHQKEVGPRVEEAFIFQLEALADKIFKEGT